MTGTETRDAVYSKSTCLAARGDRMLRKQTLQMHDFHRLAKFQQFIQVETCFRNPQSPLSTISPKVYNHTSVRLTFKSADMTLETSPA